MPRYQSTVLADFEIVKGDSLPVLDMVLEIRDPVTGLLTPVDLTTATSVTLHGKSQDGPSGAWSFPMDIIDAVNGHVRRTWLMTPTPDTAGLDSGFHDFWASVIYASGDKQTFPAAKAGGGARLMNVIPTS